MSQPLIANYQAHTNIALIKYWGKRNHSLILPVTSSLSLTLEAFYTQTQVHFSDTYSKDLFILNNLDQTGPALQSLSHYLDLFRQLAGTQLKARVVSHNFVPTAAGLASSASAYAALACACNAALGLELSSRELSILARRGSGSASRSLFGGFVEWEKGQGDDSHTSYAKSFDDANWDVAMITILVNQKKKTFSSRLAMQSTVETSPFYALWPQEVERDLEAIKEAIRQRDLDQVGQIAEHNAMKMHATLLAAQPSYTYFEADSLLAMDCVRQLRQQGFIAYFTMDAGPNVKVLCPASQAQAIQQQLSQAFHPSQLITSQPGPGPFPIPLKEDLHA